MQLPELYRLAGWLRRANIGEFLEDADAKRLFIFLDPKGELMASNHPPAAYKKNQKVRVAARGCAAVGLGGTLTRVFAPPTSLACAGDVLRENQRGPDIDGHSLTRCARGRLLR